MFGCQASFNKVEPGAGKTHEYIGKTTPDEK